MANDYEKMKPETQRKVNRVASELLAGAKLKDALTSAGYSENNRRMGTVAKRTLAQHMDDLGLDDEELSRRIIAACGAEETIWASHKGEYTDSRHVPDNKARNKALELAATVKGHVPGREFSNSYDMPVNLQVNFGVSAPATDIAPVGGLTFTIPTKPPELPDELP